MASLLRLNQVEQLQQRGQERCSPSCQDVGAPAREGGTFWGPASLWGLPPGECPARWGFPPLLLPDLRLALTPGVPCAPDPWLPALACEPHCRSLGRFWVSRLMPQTQAAAERGCRGRVPELLGIGHEAQTSQGPARHLPAANK